MVFKSLILLSTLINAAFGLKCYQCNGWSNAACNGVVTNDALATDCATNDFDACESVTIEVGTNDYKMVRLCTILAGSTPQTLYSYKATASFCTTDKCNGAGHEASNVTTPVSATYKCYNCESAYHDGCDEDDSSIRKDYEKDCNAELPGIYDSCNKIVVKIAGKFYTKRECGISFGNKGCIAIGNTGGELCTCVGNYCNSSTRLQFSMAALLAVIITAFVIAR